MRDYFNPFVADFSAQDSPGILPQNVKATQYEVKLEPDLANGTLAGSSTVHLSVLEASTFILLNCNEIEILTTEIIEESGNVIEVPRVYYNEEKQTMMVPLKKEFAKGEVIRLRQSFMGRINDAKMMAGFNRSRYRNIDGEEKWMGSTQGQPTGCRQMFPCADEPAAKATFSFTLIVDEDLTCLGNMDIATDKVIHPSTSATSKKMVVFNKTPLMSPYLVAFVVGELNYIESNKYRVPIRVYAAPDQDINKAQRALEFGVRAMIHHEETFGSPYPLPKLDMIAVPGHGGAMENWGCVIYDDKVLLRDESNASAQEIYTSARVITHELAHQWFGNIVTTAWWDSTWLNESFAEWATYNALTSMHPDWDVWSRFVIEGYQKALELDSNRGSHPIEVPVSSPSQITQIFDYITYHKGCSVLRMIAEDLGVEVFVKGVRLHLERHAFGNATTNDLWDSLSTVSGKDVKAIMATWTNKVGYPVLFVTEHEASSTIEITQHRFLQSGKTLAEDDEVLYPVYLKIKSQRGISKEAKLFSRKKTFPVGRFYKLNAGQTGLFRVSYQLDRLHKFSNQLYTGFLSPDDRVGLISDLCALVRSSEGTKARTSDFFNFLLKFEDETDFFVWSQIIASLRDIKKAWMFKDGATRRAIDRFQLRLMTKLLHNLDEKIWNFKPTDSYNKQSFKALLFSNAAGYDPVQAISSFFFERFMDGDYEFLNPNIRKAAFSLVLASEKSTESQYNAVLATYQNPSHGLQVRTDAVASLGSADHPSLIDRTLAIALKSQLLGGNERFAIFKSLLEHPNGVYASWQWLQANLEKLSDDPASISRGAIVSVCIQDLSTADHLEEVERFFEMKDTSSFNKFLEQGLDEIRGKIDWVERDGENVAEWLDANGYYENIT